MEWLAERYRLSEQDVFGNQVPFHFDVSNHDIYGALKFGACTVIIPRQLFMFPIKLIRFLNEYRVSMIFWVPFALSMVANFKAMEKEKPEYLRHIFFAGEVIDVYKRQVQEEKQQNQAQSGEPQAYTGNPADYAGTYDSGSGYSVTFTVSGNGLMENGDPNMVFHHMDGYNCAFFFINNDYAKDSYIFAAPGVLATDWEYISDNNYAVKKTAARH